MFTHMRCPDTLAVAKERVLLMILSSGDTVITWALGQGKHQGRPMCLYHTCVHVSILYMAEC